MITYDPFPVFLRDILRRYLVKDIVDLVANYSHYDVRFSERPGMYRHPWLYWDDIRQEKHANFLLLAATQVFISHAKMKQLQGTIVPTDETMFYGEMGRTVALRWRCDLRPYVTVQEKIHELIDQCRSYLKQICDEESFYLSGVWIYPTCQTGEYQATLRVRRNNPAADVQLLIVALAQFFRGEIQPAGCANLNEIVALLGPWIHLSS